MSFGRSLQYPRPWGSFCKYALLRPCRNSLCSFEASEENRDRNGLGPEQFVVLRLESRQPISCLSLGDFLGTNDHDQSRTF